MTREVQAPTLFLACTRPAMVAGAPMEAVGLNLILSACAVLLSRSPAWLVLAPVLHLVFRAVAKSDAFAFRILGLYLLTQARSERSRVFGGASFAPSLTHRFLHATALFGGRR